MKIPFGARNTRKMLSYGAALFFTFILATAAVIFYLNSLNPPGLSIGMQINYSDGSTLTRHSGTPLQITDPSNGRTVSTFNINLDSVVDYKLASGVSITSWSFQGVANIKIMDPQTGSVISDFGNTQLSAPNTVSGATFAAPRVSQILFSSTTTMATLENALSSSSSQIPSFNWGTSHQYNYIFTLQGGASVTLHLSNGQTLTQSTSQAATLTWAFSRSPDNTFTSLSMIWAGSAAYN